MKIITAQLTNEERMILLGALENAAEASLASASGPSDPAGFSREYTVTVDLHDAISDARTITLTMPRGQE